MRTIEREIKTSVLPKVKELMDSDEGSGKSHEEICDMFLQKEFVSTYNRNLAMFLFMV